MAEPLKIAPFCPILKDDCREACQIMVENSDGSKYCAIFLIETALHAIEEKLSQFVVIAEQIRIEGLK